MKVTMTEDKLVVLRNKFERLKAGESYDLPHRLAHHLWKQGYLANSKRPITEGDD